MKPPPFDFFAPASVAEAVSLLQQHGEEAKVLAGGQSLLPLLNMRLARPTVLVDINRIRDLDYIRQNHGHLSVGAITRHRAVEHSEQVLRTQPLLAEAVRHIAHPQIRNRGTLGGSIAHADPAAELPAVCLALAAEMRAVGPEGERWIKAEDFFITYLTTALGPNELLAEVRFPLPGPNTGWGFREVSRRHGDFALAGAAATVTVDSDGRCAAARLALFGVAGVPLRARATERILVGEIITPEALTAAAEAAAGEIEEPISDIHASSEFRRHLAKTLARQALADAATRAANQVDEETR